MIRIAGLIFLFVLFMNPLVKGQDKWEERENKNGIVIYSRSSEYSSFDEFKAVTTIDQSVHAFVAVLRDIDRIPNWMHSVKYSKFLERSGDSTQVYYTEAAVPFPLKNRDGIYLNRFNWNKKSRTLHVDIEILPDYLDKEDKLVRISRGRGFWQAKELSGGGLELIFQMQVDPGGSIPSWLANMFVVDTPFQTLTKLKQIIGEEQYSKTKYDFID